MHLFSMPWKSPSAMQFSFCFQGHYSNNIVIANSLQRTWRACWSYASFLHMQCTTLSTSLTGTKTAGFFQTAASPLRLVLSSREATGVAFEDSHLQVSQKNLKEAHSTSFPTLHDKQREQLWTAFWRASLYILRVGSRRGEMNPSSLMIFSLTIGCTRGLGILLKHNGYFQLGGKVPS